MKLAHQLVFSFIALMLLVSTSVEARHPYYPETFREMVRSSSDAESLKNHTFEVLSQPHLRVNNGPDLLGCDHRGVRGTCYRQESLGYKEARVQLFGKIHLQQKNGRYVIEDIYCLKQFDQSAGVGPGRIPRNNVLNTEHVWPQSKFSNRFPTHLQKADLHHLYPSDSRSNSTRGNNPFDEVSGAPLSGCESARTGSNRNLDRRGEAFEPPDESKGNIARAMMYFSIRYNLPLSKSEIEVLSQWHELDPVDELEIHRNDAIYELQGNRNPFIDYPELFDLIAS